MFGIKIKDTINATAEIPNQVRTMTAVVIVVGMVSLLALLMSVVAVRHAD